MADTKNPKESGKKPFGNKPKVMRMSSEEASSYKEKKRFASESQAGDSASEPPRRFRDKRPLEPHKANVHLNLSPRLLALAEEFAEELGMPVSKYLVECIRYVVYAKADSQPKHDRYRTEFVSKNKRSLSGWSPESDKEESDGGYGSDFRSRSGSGSGSGSDSDSRSRPRRRDDERSTERKEGSGGFDKRRRDGKFRSKEGASGPRQKRSGSTQGSGRGRFSNDKKRGSSSGSSGSSAGRQSRKPSHGRGNAGKKRGR